MTEVSDALQAFGRVRNLAPSRERIEELRRIAHLVEPEDAQLLEDFAMILLQIRQAVRGGSLEIRGSRHWSEL